MAFWHSALGVLYGSFYIETLPGDTVFYFEMAADSAPAYVPGTGARIISLVGGPCTEGPGTIVSKDLSDPVRSHKDLDEDAAPFFKKAVNFYENLACG